MGVWGVETSGEWFPLLLDDVFRLLGREEFRNYGFKLCMVRARRNLISDFTGLIL